LGLVSVETVEAIADGDLSEDAKQRQCGKGRTAVLQSSKANEAKSPTHSNLGPCLSQGDPRLNVSIG